MRSSSPGSVRALLRDLRNGSGLALLGAAVGGGAFLVVDSFKPADVRKPVNGLSLRAPYYHTCREALQDGRVNIARDEPGYRSELDADNDGLACEPYRPN